jgi:hypothetical protein
MKTSARQSGFLLNTTARFLELATTSSVHGSHKSKSDITKLEQMYLMKESSSLLPEQLQKLGNLSKLSSSFNLQLNASQLSQINQLSPSLIPTAMNTSALLNLAKQDR